MAASRAAEVLEGRDGLVEVAPPLEGVAVRQDQGDVQLGFDVAGPVALELEVRVPGRLTDGAVEEGVDVVAEAGEARVLDRREAAARLVPPLEAQDAQSGLAEVGLEHEAVVARPENDPVEVARRTSGRAAEIGAREALAAREDAAGLAKALRLGERTRRARPC